MQRLLSKVNAWCALVSGAILLVSLAAVLYAVFARYLFNVAVTWAFDLTSYGLLFIVFLAAARTLEVGGHIQVDFLRSPLSEHARRFVEVGVQSLSLVFFLLLLWATALKTWHSITDDWVSPSIYEIPLRYIYWIMPAGVSLMLLVGLFKFGEAVARWRNGNPDDPAATDQTR